MDDASRRRRAYSRNSQRCPAKCLSVTLLSESATSADSCRQGSSLTDRHTKLIPSAVLLAPLAPTAGWYQKPSSQVMHACGKGTVMGVSASRWSWSEGFVAGGTDSGFWSYRCVRASGDRRRGEANEGTASRQLSQGGRWLQPTIRGQRTPAGMLHLQTPSSQMSSNRAALHFTQWVVPPSLVT
jgi:hypothetical protein